jgi:dipeptidyl-peptidase 7. Serine peptidase. MEROPS family S46
MYPWRWKNIWPSTWEESKRETSLS